jgi:hypothetical protein
MYFCIRDDDTSFFTSPRELEAAYGQISQWGPVSLAVVPFHRAGTSKGVPEKFRGRWTVHPLHENRDLVEYLRLGIAKGRFEIMLHGYYHDEPNIRFEFAAGNHLAKRVSEGRKYLEDLLSARIRVFVAPRNTIGRQGLRALAAEGLHLGGVTGLRSGWSLLSRKSWHSWLYLRRWRRKGGLGVPWILDLGDHREISGNSVTPASSLQRNQAVFEVALKMGGAFCLSTHYWELGLPSKYPGEPTVGEHMKYLVDRARTASQIMWRSVGDTIANGPTI